MQRGTQEGREKREGEEKGSGDHRETKYVSSSWLFVFSKPPIAFFF